MRLLRLASLLAVLALVPAGTASAAVAPPKMPVSVAHLKECGFAKRFGGKFLVYVVKGKSLSCKRARAIVRLPPLKPIEGYRFYDWTKSDEDTFWSDVYQSTSGRTVIGAVVQA